MAPGRRRTTRAKSPTAQEITEYEKTTREAAIMRNNAMLNSLGINQLKAFLEASGKKTNKASSSNQLVADPEASGSIYENENSETSTGSEAENQAISCSKQQACSKRISAKRPTPMPPPTVRVTRQRAAAANTATETETPNTEQQLAATSTPQLEVPTATTQGEINESQDEHPRGRSMGIGLERMTRGLNSKIPIRISEGNKRPAAPIEAAKFASEGGIILRQHIPIYTHWKKYEEDKIENYKGKVAAQFTVDVNDKALSEACTDLLKGGQRQMRHRLKKAYFNGVPADKVRTTSPLESMTDQEWMQLVELWSTPKHKDTCQKNKVNRGHVLFHQRTGSRSFVAHAHVTKEEKFKDSTPTAIDLLKETHCSKKNGFSDPVKKAIADMEAIVAEPVEDGQQKKTCTEAVSQVLPKHNTFLQIMGMQSASNKKSRGSQLHALEAQLENEKQESAVLREQLHTLREQAEQSEKDRAKQAEEIESLKKTTEETNALLRRMFNFSGGQS